MSERQPWRGVRFKTIAELAAPNDDARFVLCTGYDFMPGTFIPYTTSLPIERAIEDDVLLVHTWEGKALPREHGGPCRMITPKLYAWKDTKWIRRIESLADDRKGFWEVRSAGMLLNLLLPVPFRNTRLHPAIPASR